MANYLEDLLSEDYKNGYSDAFEEMKKEFEYLLNCGIGKKKCLEHLIKIADKNIISG